MEMVTAEIFKTRVYPLPANGSRTVRISYETRVSVNETNQFIHIVPATIAKGIDALSVRVHCLGLSEQSYPMIEQIEGSAADTFDFVWQAGAQGPGLLLLVLTFLCVLFDMVSSLGLGEKIVF